MVCILDVVSVQLQCAVVKKTVSVLERCFNNGQSWNRGNVYPHVVVPGFCALSGTFPTVFHPPLLLTVRPLQPPPSRFLTHMLLAAAIGIAAAV